MHADHPLRWPTFARRSTNRKSKQRKFPKYLSTGLTVAPGKIILPGVRKFGMTVDDARAAIIKTLEKVQSASGLPCPTLTGVDVPTKVLDQFDSTVWPVATSWIAKELGVKIPNDVHVFGGKDGASLLTINQSAELICTKHKLDDSLAEAAE